MMIVQQADGSPLKRTFPLASDSPPPPGGSGKPRTTLISPAQRRMSISLKRRYPFCGSPLSSSFTPDTISPVEPNTSVFSSTEVEDIVMSDCQSVTNQFHILPNSEETTLPVMTSSSTEPLSYPHNSHSTSSSASSSNNSSPTTTISTTDSTIEFDTPPNPTSLAGFTPRNMARNSTEDLKIVPSTSSGSSPQSMSPSKKARNAKNLSLNVPPPSSAPRAQPTGVDPSLQGISPRSVSAPNSPAFILPPPPPAPKRKPSNLGLTIKLPSTLGQSSGIQAVGKGSLRHHQSSPSLFSPGPNSLRGGMTLPPINQPRLYHPPRNMVPLSIPSSESSVSSVSPPRSPPPVLNEMDEEFEDEPRSGEAKSPAYPSGPVCIFEPNIYLFAEPDAKLASEFDVVINVAREVLNPFNERDKRLAERHKEERNYSRRESMAPETGCTDASFTTAFEEAIFSPMETPTATRSNDTEYIHMPWDHNTPIVDELPGLVKIIKDRVADRKKILVHCQCGVSRSASLLIAYALFLKPEQTVQEAYDSVKRKSRWIGPNMSLIFQLAEWKKRLGKEDLGQPGFRLGMGKQSAAPTNNFGRKGRNLAAVVGESDEMSEPLTAPLPQRPLPSSPVKQKPTNPKHHIPQMVRTRSENGGILPDVMPAPSSAPPGMITIPHKYFPPTPQSTSDQSIPAEVDYGTPMQEPATSLYLMKADGEPKPRSIKSIRPEEGNQPLGFGQSHEEDPVPPFKSPRSSGYFGFGLPLRREMPGFILQDPRSPNRGQETPVIRSIFDVL